METGMDDHGTRPNRPPRRRPAGRCPVCGGTLETKRPRDGTTVVWCRGYCWCRIEHPDGSVSEGNLGLGDSLRWAG